MVHKKAKKKTKKKGKKVAPAVGLDMRLTLFHKAAVKGHLEICQTIMWSLEIINFTNFHPRDDKDLTFLHQAAA
jgi:hypothetical protein